MLLLGLLWFLWCAVICELFLLRPPLWPRRGMRRGGVPAAWLWSSSRAHSARWVLGMSSAAGGHHSKGSLCRAGSSLSFMFASVLWFCDALTFQKCAVSGVGSCLYLPINPCSGSHTASTKYFPLVLPSFKRFIYYVYH